MSRKMSVLVLIILYIVCFLVIPAASSWHDGSGLFSEEAFNRIRTMFIVGFPPILISLTIYYMIRYFWRKHG